MSRLSLAVYSLLMRWLQPLLRRKLLRRGQQEPGYLHAMPERQGHYAAPANLPAQTGAVWIHAVSLGETRAAGVLMAALRGAQPGIRFLLTHGTATGRAEGAGLLHPGDLQVWQPWDTPAAVQRFLNHYQPRLGLLMETEVWPNLTHFCAQQGVPLLLLNARMNAASATRAQRLAWLSRPAYAALAAVLAQTPDDAERLRALGAPVTGVFGNLKFDAQPDAAQLAQGRAWRAGLGKPVLMLASSREGEEALFIAKIVALAQAKPAGTASDSIANAVRWLIVPRHPQRFDAVAALVVAAGLSLSRRSQWHGTPQEADIWLGDSMGDMALYYGMSDAALLGGSFAPLGGQNLIEALACGCPVLLGPHTFNFAEAADMAVAAGAAQRAADLARGVASALALLHDAPARAAMQQNAGLFVAAHAGAVAKTCAALAPWLKEKRI